MKTLNMVSSSSTLHDTNPHLPMVGLCQCWRRQPSLTVATLPSLFLILSSLRARLFNGILPSKHEPLPPTPRWRHRKLPGPSEPPMTTPNATRSITSLCDTPNIPISSFARHTKSGICAAELYCRAPNCFDFGSLDCWVFVLVVGCDGSGGC